MNLDMNPGESVVHEYIVLYSNRIIQREKKWNDGIMRYYEFNNKVEVINGDGYIIETDFVSNKFGNQLHEGKQLRLPSDRILVEIEGKISKYTRNLSAFFSKERRQLELSPKKPLPSYSNDFDKRNKKRKLCQNETIMVKKEPAGPFIRVKPEIKVEKESTDIQKHSDSDIENPEGTSRKVKKENYNHSERLRKEDPAYSSSHFSKRAKANMYTRIPPRSSKIFKYLQKNTSAF